MATVWGTKSTITLWNASQPPNWLALVDSVTCVPREHVLHSLINVIYSFYLIFGIQLIHSFIYLSIHSHLSALFLHSGLLEGLLELMPAVSDEGGTATGASGQFIAGPHEKTNNHLCSVLRQSWKSQFTSLTCFWTVGGSWNARREPIQRHWWNKSKWSSCYSNSWQPYLITLLLLDIIQHPKCKNISTYNCASYGKIANSMIENNVKQKERNRLRKKQLILIIHLFFSFF